MSQLVDDQDWESYKDTIRRLYVTEGHTLEGQNGVIFLMENNHSFKKTKAQYEVQFRKWKLRKNRTKTDWKIISQKIEDRKRKAKESEVYVNGDLVPYKKLRKELSRQGYIPIMEQFNLSQEACPRTPEGVEILTPFEQSSHSSFFENLPMVLFQERLQSLPKLMESITIDPDISAIVLTMNPLTKKSLENIRPLMDSLLPDATFLKSNSSKGTGSEVKRVEKLLPEEILNLIVFLCSNNLLDGENGEQFNEWLMCHWDDSVLRSLSSIKGPAVEAMMEKLFRAAIEAEKTTTVELLLKIGINPNGHKCRHKSIYDDLTPLQFACIQGNIRIARALIKVGSDLDEPHGGWKKSILTIAIIGQYCRDHGNCFLDLTEGDWVGVSINQHAQSSENLLALVGLLIKRGAAINFENEDYAGSSDGFGNNIQSCCNGQSPLTAAARSRYKPVVDLLLESGANIHYITDDSASALQECLYPWRTMVEDLEKKSNLQPLSYRVPPDAVLRRRAEIMDVVESLVNEGIGTETKAGYCFCTTEQCNYLSSPYGALTESDSDCNWDGEHYMRWGSRPRSSKCSLYTTLDICVLIGCIELFDRLLMAGASMTTKSAMEFAIESGDYEIFKRLLFIGAPISSGAVSRAMEKKNGDVFINTLLAQRPAFQTRRTILLRAIEAGQVKIIEDLFRSHPPSELRTLIYPSAQLTSAIEKCCCEGHIDVLSLVIEKLANSSTIYHENFGMSLNLAAKHGHLQIVRALISAGARLDKKGEDGSTTLLTATRYQHTKVAEILIDAGAELKVWKKCCILSTSGDVFVSAILNDDFTLIEKLRGAGVDAQALGSMHAYRDQDCRCDSGIMPLTAAIMKENYALTRDLLSLGVMVNNPTKDPLRRMTPLSAAAAKSDMALIKLLLEAKADPYDARALQEATSDFEVFQYLLSQLHDPKELSRDKHLLRDALCDAVSKKNGRIIRSILQGPVRNFLTTDCVSVALSKAFDLPNSRYRPKIIRTLLESGADPNFQWKNNKFTEYHRCALYEAVLDLDIQTVSLLLDAGAGLNVTCGGIKSALDCAFEYPCDLNIEIVDLLLSRGADANERLRTQMTPIQIATDDGTISLIRLLLRHKANINLKFDDSLDFDSDHSPALFRVPFNLTPIQIACRDGNFDLVRLFIEHGADVNVPAGRIRGATALQFAAMGGFLGIALLLLKNGAEVNAPAAEIDGRTALEGAAERGRIDMVQLLLNAGARIIHEGQTQYEKAIRRASENGYHALKRLLEEYRANLD